MRVGDRPLGIARAPGRGQCAELVGVAAEPFGDDARLVDRAVQRAPHCDIAEGHVALVAVDDPDQDAVRVHRHERRVLAVEHPLRVSGRDLGQDVDLALPVADGRERIVGWQVVDEDGALDAGAALGVVPVIGIALEDQPRRSLLALDHPGRGVGIRADHDALGDHGGVTLNQREHSGAPRARLIDHSPMALPGADLGVAEPELIPERVARDVEPAHLAQRQPVGSGEVEADRVVVDDDRLRLRREVEPGARWVWRDPALHLVEVALDRVGGERRPVLERDPLAEVELQDVVVDPAGVLGKGHDGTTVLIHPDGLLHGVPGDEQPVQR